MFLFLHIDLQEYWSFLASEGCLRGQRQPPKLHEGWLKRLTIWRDCVRSFVVVVVNCKQILSSFKYRGAKRPTREDV